MNIVKSEYYVQDTNSNLQRIIDDALAGCTKHLAGLDRLNLWGSSDEKFYPIRIMQEGDTLTLYLSVKSNESNIADVKNYIVAYDATGDHNLAKRYMEKCKDLLSAAPPKSPPMDCTMPAWLLEIAKIIHETTGITPVKGWDLWLMANAESREGQEVIAISSIRRVAAIVPRPGELIDVSKLIRELIKGMGAMDPLVVHMKMPGPEINKGGVMVKDPGGTCWETIAKEAVLWSDVMKHNIIWRR